MNIRTSVDKLVKLYFSIGGIGDDAGRKGHQSKTKGSPIRQRKWQYFKRFPILWFLPALLFLYVVENPMTQKCIIFSVIDFFENERAGRTLKRLELG